MITTTTLKNAAFAIEHDLFTDPDGANYLVKDGAILRRWEPLLDDGDALRLAVALRIETEFFGCTVYAGPRKTAKYAVDTEFDRDMFSAVRIAIVRAASEIGESLKCQS